MMTTIAALSNRQLNIVLSMLNNKISFLWNRGTRNYALARFGAVCRGERVTSGGWENRHHLHQSP